METRTHFILFTFNWEVECLSLLLIIIFHLNVFRTSLHEEQCPVRSLNIIFCIWKPLPSIVTDGACGCQQRRKEISKTQGPAGSSVELPAGHSPASL